VGSEMCIRDRIYNNKPPHAPEKTNPIFVSGTPLIIYNYRAVKEKPIHKFVDYRP